MKVLIVEDNADLGRLLQLEMEDAGHIAHLTRDIAQAVEAVRGAKFDVVISDLSLPDGDGRTLARELRQSHPDLPLIAVSGYASAVDVALCHDAGFTAHVDKFGGAGALLEEINRLKK